MNWVNKMNRQNILYRQAYTSTLLVYLLHRCVEKNLFACL